MNARLTRSLTIFCTRIQKLLRAHLEESGWVDDLKDLAEGENEGWKRQRLEADLPSHGIISLLFNITFCLKISINCIIPWLCLIATYSAPILHTKRKRNCQYTMSLLEPPAWPAVCNKQKKLGLRMYQTSRASSNKSVRAQLVSLFLPPLPFPFSSYSTSPLHLPF